MHAERMNKYMQKNLEQELFDSYNFMQTDENCCIPCDCGSGWFSLIKAFCSELAGYCKINNINVLDFDISQVKQKMGTMRICYSSSDKMIIDYLFSLTNKYEHLSSEICEQCGSQGTLQIVNSYRQVLCEGCLKSKII